MIFVNNERIKKWGQRFLDTAHLRGPDAHLCGPNAHLLGPNAQLCGPNAQLRGPIASESHGT